MPLLHSQVGALAIDCLDHRGNVVVITVFFRLGTDLDGVNQFRAGSRTTIDVQYNLKAIPITVTQPVDLPNYIIRCNLRRADLLRSILVIFPRAIQGGTGRQCISDEDCSVYWHVPIIAIANVVADLATGDQLAPVPILINVKIGVWITHITPPG